MTATLEAPTRRVDDGIAVLPPARRQPAPGLLRAAPVAAVGVLALLLRLLEVTRSYDLFVDEITYGTIARNIAGGAGLSLYGSPFTLHPPAFLGFDALVITVFGIHGSVDHIVMSLRPVSACFGALGCVGAYLLLGRVASRRVAFVAALVLALDPFVISYDSQVMLEAAAGAATVATFGLLAGAVQTTEPRRRARFVVGAGLMAAVVVTTKDTFGLVTVVGLLALLATGWTVRRREALLVVEMAAAGYAVYLIALATIGDLSVWWSSNIDGFLRLVGAHQQTGFNAPSVHVSLVSRAFADLGGTATSYLILAAGPFAALAVVWVLRPWQPGWQERATARQRASVVVAAWALAAAAYLSYATLFGSIEEQMYYILLPPALCAVVAATVTVRWRRGWLRTAGRIAVAATLLYSAGIWVHVHTTPADGYNRFLAWESTHIPDGATVSVTEGQAQFLLQNLVLGDWDTRAELVEHRVDYVVISTRLTDQGYEASVPFLDMLRAHGRLIYSDHFAVGLQVYDVQALTGAT